MITKKIIKYNIKEDNNNSLSIPLNTDLELKIHDDDKKTIYLIHKVLKWQLYQHRQGSASTKKRNEVRGGGKKPWKQKGTGRARAGSNRSPLWKGGGVIFGPKSKVYKSKINKKEKKLAIQNILYNKLYKTSIINNTITEINKPNTKNILHEIKKLNIDTNKNHKILIIVPSACNNLYLSIRNIQNIDMISVKNLNIITLLKSDTILLTIDGLKALQKIYND